MQQISVLGAGSFGTTLAHLLAHSGSRVALLSRSEETAHKINQTRTNPAYFPDSQLPINITATADISAALSGSNTVYLAVPCKYLRNFVEEHAAALASWLQYGGGDAASGAGPGAEVADMDRVVCNCTKGLLLEPTQRTNEWLAAWMAQASTPGCALVHLSGPNLAAEIMAGAPAAAVAAALQDQQWAAQRVQAQLMSPLYRVYTGSDPVGVEVAGFYKNVLAIAAGALQGLELGSNSLAALITRGLAEMGRLVRYFGGDPASLLGLAGVGDLVATCGSPLSRNFQVGMRRARGESSAAILASMQQVAEGVQTSRALHEWAVAPPAPGRQDADWPELPIAAEVYRILFEELEPRSAIIALMQRPPRGESV